MKNDSRQKLQQIIEPSDANGHTLFEQIVFAIILLNAIVIYLQESGYDYTWLAVVDYACTLAFVLEMALKQYAFGIRGYWRRGWNKLDGTLVLISLPSLLMPFVEYEGANLSVLLVLRLLRVLKAFRVIHFFPKFSELVKGFKLAMRESWAILACYVVVIFIFGLINCSLFKGVAPDYFATPTLSIYSVFRLFTVEGWYDIPDAIAIASSPIMGKLVRFYFCLLLLGGGIIGMSFINSVFVDAMAEDNNDDVKEQLRRLEEKVDELLKKQ